MWRKRIIASVTPYGQFRQLERHLRDCRSILDLGCGTDSMIQLFCHDRFVVGMDRYLPSLKHNQSCGEYAALINGDILDWALKDASFDAVVALDVIEHFSREDGARLLDNMERAARRVVLVLTPNGFVPQPANTNPWQLHRSGWTADDFKARGYEVGGVYGSRALRGVYSQLTRRPKWIWELVSALSQPYVKSRPERAFALLAARKVKP